MGCIAILNRVGTAQKDLGKPHITKKERIILDMICDDQSNKQMAMTLGNSVKTIEKHRQALSRFSRTHSPISLYKWALANSYAKPPKLVDK